jgi:peptidoglycan/LPS O-acetylase OafA/YrhL
MDSRSAVRITQIDGLRGIAACLVMGYHLTTRYEGLYHHTQSLPFHLFWGNLGVQLFFAISGFVILMTLRNARAPLDFAVSRFSRLYPTYWACMLLTAALLALFPLPNHQLSLGQVAGNLLMFHQLFGVEDVNGAYWTLQIELIFYVLMLLLWTVGLLRRPLLPLIGWLAVSLISKFVAVPWVVTNIGLLDWMPWFGIGISMYVLAGKHEDYKLVPVVLLLCAAVIVKAESLSHLGWAALVMALMYAAALNKLVGAASTALLFLGAISYPLYLLHEYLSYSLMMRIERLGLHSIAAVLIAAAGSIGLAYLLHRFAENPSMRWIRARYKKREAPSNLLVWKVGIVATLALFAVGPRLIHV